MLTPEECALLATAQHLADTLFEPNAERVDQSGRVPIENLMALAAANLVDLNTRSEGFRRAFIEILCAACGTTYFTLTQHLGCAGQLAACGNPNLQRFLPEMARGSHWVGVAFGHLRRPQSMVTATPVEDGWTLSGTAPWVTGWPILSGVIYGAHLPTGEHLYVYSDATKSPAQQPSAPLPLCAMNATETVEVVLNQLFVPQENFIRLSSAEELARGDTKNLVGNVSPMFGVARGALKQLRSIAAKKASLPAILAAADTLDAELIDCRTQCERLREADKTEASWNAEALAARAWSIELGVRAAHTALAAASGSANSLDHPAQRRFREAMFYTLFQQNNAILSATVARLSHKK
jgi:alkylation response protein AidB-like acyl-CoA dehydrogenase